MEAVVVERNAVGVEPKDFFGKISQLVAWDVTQKFQQSMIQMLPSHAALIDSINEYVLRHVRMAAQS